MRIKQIKDTISYIEQMIQICMNHADIAVVEVRCSIYIYIYIHHNIAHRFFGRCFSWSGLSIFVRVRQSVQKNSLSIKLNKL